MKQGRGWGELVRHWRAQSAGARMVSHVLLGSSLLFALGAQAGMVTDKHGNVGYDTAAECDAAVYAGTARFYQPVTEKAPRAREGEATVRIVRMADLAQVAEQAAGQLGFDAADYTRGACDLGVREADGRADVTPELVGKWVPFGPDMPLNLYADIEGTPVRVTMAHCDNRFSAVLPRPVPPAQTVAQAVPEPVPVAAQATPNQCYANILVPARFETRTEKVLMRPATRREVAVPATYRTVTEQVLEQPEHTRVVVEPAEVQTVTEPVVVRPAGTREEPVAPTFTTRVDQLETRPAAQRVEVIPATYRTERQRVVNRPAHTINKVIPAVYDEVEEEVLLRPATTRTVTVPASYKTEIERVLVRPEVLQYIPVKLPMKQVPETHKVAEASTRIVPLPPIMKTVTEPVEVQPASVRQMEVPAAWEIVTERIKVKDAHLEWRRGRAWVGQALEVVPVRSFIVGPEGRFRGHAVSDRTLVPAASGSGTLGVLDTGLTSSDNRDLEDDVWCLVQVPDQYQTVQRKVLKAPATTSDEIEPATYRNVTKKVIVREAGAQTEQVPAQYRTFYRPEVDFAAARAQGYKFDEAGRLVATPKGEPLRRAADVAARPGVQIDVSLAADAWVREVRIPAHYRDVTRYVVDQPARVDVEQVPAVYRTVRRRVEVEPARTEVVHVPATYREVAVQVLDQPERVVRVDEPAEHVAVTHYALDQPAGLRQVPVPAMVQRVEREVVTRPAGTREEMVPAVYRSVQRQEVDQPASTRWVDEPAEYRTITWQEKVSEAHEQRVEVMCETNTPTAKVREVQLALQAAGFDPGVYSGALNPDTLQAVARFQQARELPVHGYLDPVTVRALGVMPN